MNNTITVNGIIIKETKVGEGNKIFTILTDSIGKIQASAGGVRSYKSKLAAGCGLYMFSKFLLKQGKNMFNITSADCSCSFYDLRKDVVKLAYATYFCDLLNAVTVEDEANEIVRLILNTLYFLENKEEYKIAKPVFEFRLMKECGFMPDIFTCNKCGSHNDISYFSVNDGIVYCKNCINESNISVNTVNAIRYILTADCKKMFSFVLNDITMTEVEKFAEKYVITQIDRELRSLSYLKQF